MNNLIRFLEASIKKLDEKEKYEKVISLLNDYIGSGIKISEENRVFLKEVFDEITSNEDFNDIQRNRADFITNVLIKIGKELDDEQVKLCHLISKKIEEKIKSGSKNSNSYEKLLDSLNSNKKFTDFELLEDILNESDIDIHEQLDIVKELITRNYRFTNVTTNSKEEVETLEESEETKEYNNSYEDVRDLLAEYGVDTDKFADNSKEYLVKYVNLDNAREILDTLKENKINFYKKGNTKSEQYLVFTLIKSKKEIVDDVKAICNENGIPYKKVVELFPMNIIPTLGCGFLWFSSSKKTGPNYGLIRGNYQGFKKLIEFLNEKNVYLPGLFKKCSSVFAKPVGAFKKNWDILEKQYEIEVNKDSLSSLVRTRLADQIDKYIEIFENGLEFVSENQSTLANTTAKDFINFKTAEMNGIHLLCYNSKGNIFKKKCESEFLYPKHEFVSLELPNGKEKVYDEMELNETTFFDEKVSDNELFKLLEQHYASGNMLYRLDDTRVSRTKVHRILSNMMKQGIEIGEDEIKYALAYNSVLSKKDLENIESFKTLFDKENEVEEIDYAQFFRRGN